MSEELTPTLGEMLNNSDSRRAEMTQRRAQEFVDRIDAIEAEAFGVFRMLERLRHDLMKEYGIAPPRRPPVDPRYEQVVTEREEPKTVPQGQERGA